MSKPSAAWATHGCRIMFNKLQRKLALTYSLAFFVTLAVILFILFLIFRSMIYNSVGWEINDIAKDQQNEFQQMHTITGTPFQSSIYLSAFLSNDGKDIVYKGSLTKFLRQTFQKKINRGLTTGTLDFHNRNGEKIHLIYATKPIVKNNRLIGDILVVKNIARTHEQIEHWFLILFMIGILTAGLSIIIAHFLARRAVRPVKKNFDKQRAFVADASHELRTPLSVFSASLEFFEAEEKERLSESSRETLADLKEEVRDMNTLISHLLSLARADRGGLAQEKKRFLLAECIKPLLAYYRQKALDSQKTFSFVMPAGTSICLEANPVEIKQLLAIFLDNALKYTKIGDHISLNVSAIETRHQVLFTIRDTGGGIPKQEIAHIFDRFYRVEKGRARESGGSGLGLSIARSIVQAYKGQIDVTSRVGEGTTFQITLPVLQKAE